MLHTPLTFTFFFFNDTATTEIYTLSLHDALPICRVDPLLVPINGLQFLHQTHNCSVHISRLGVQILRQFVKAYRSHSVPPDRKSTRLNSSHSQISYAVFCLKKKKENKRYRIIYDE